jgi:hypothetical protein
MLACPFAAFHLPWREGEREMEGEMERGREGRRGVGKEGSGREGRGSGGGRGGERQRRKETLLDLTLDIQLKTSRSSRALNPKPQTLNPKP